MAPPEPPPLYGAVGDRAAGDLVATFDRMFATAESGDRVFCGVPVGFAAGADVTFALSPEGELASTRVSANAAPALRAAIQRTMALMKHRAFTAKAATTHLHMSVRVTGDLAYGGAFAIGAAGWFEACGRRVRLAISER